MASSADDRPGRAQLGAALLLGFVLVGSGLYIWRRPARAAQEASDVAPSSSALASLGDAGAILGAAPADAAAPSPVALTEARVLACQDPGPKKTAPDACDRLGPVEKALADAINQSATCVQSASSPESGTIEYVADVSFARHRLGVILPRAGRSVRDRKAIHSCATAVRSALKGVALEGIDHQHARYKIAVTATYRGNTTPGG